MNCPPGLIDVHSHGFYVASSLAEVSVKDSKKKKDSISKDAYNM
jgi:imidazolonepropionase-like amidohydrolase